MPYPILRKKTVSGYVRTWKTDWPLSRSIQWTPAW